MESMFYNCHSLKEIDLTKLATGSVTTMKNMFSGCRALTYLDLSNMDTSLVTDMRNIFFNCIKLTSINLENFNTSLVNDMQSMFNGCNSLISLNLSSFNTSMVTNMKSMFFYCNNLISLDLSNFNFENTIDMSSMLSGCINLIYINFYNYNDDFNINIKNIFYGTSDNLILYINNSSNTDKIKYQLTSLQCITYNLSINIKEKRRIINDKRICLNECINSEFYKYEYNYLCYKECPIGTYSLNNNRYICEENQVECIKSYQFINLVDKSCIKYCNSEDFFNKKCSLSNNNIENKKILISNIINEIEDGTIDKLIKEYLYKNKNDLLIKENDILYQVTTALNQNNKDYKNISTIKLGELENIIKEKYNISKDNTLIIVKIEQNIEGLLIPFIDFEIFNPKTKEKLDLNFLNDDNSNFEFYIPVYINETSLYKYELNSSYYNDICNTLSENGYDITLYDRKNEYINKNLSLCQNNCKYMRYDYSNKKVICQCNIKERISFLSQNNETIFLSNIKFVKSLLNLNVMKCYKLLFSKKGLIKNIGNYLFLLLIILYIIFAFLFYIKGFNSLCKLINDILIFKNEEYKYEINPNDPFKDVKKNKFNNLENISSPKNHKKLNNKNRIYKIGSQSQTNLDFTISSDAINIEKKYPKSRKENQIIYTDYEINHFSYEVAIKNDQRTIFQLYFSFLKVNLFALYIFKNNNKEYNSYIIKINLFLFYIAIFLFVNALFFNDSMMHIIFESKNKLNFINMLPNILYSTIICNIIIYITNRLSLSERNLLELKNEKNKYNLKAKTILVIKFLIIKYIIFFIISILFLIFFWYYLSCFCSVFSNTQIYLIKNTLISILISVIYHLIICLFPSIFRTSALKGVSGKLLYTISQIIQLF